jgi:hypothetical protein
LIFLPPFLSRKKGGARRTGELYNNIRLKQKRLLLQSKKLPETLLKDQAGSGMARPCTCFLTFTGTYFFPHAVNSPYISHILFFTLYNTALTQTAELLAIIL